MLPLAVVLHLGVALLATVPDDAATPAATVAPAAASTSTSAPARLAVAPLPPPIAPPLLAPALDPGPFGASELAAAAAGALLGDALVLGAGYGTLRLFANGSIDPTAAHFRNAAYAFGASALLVPPLTAVLLARWARAEPASGSVWKALALATLGQAAALGAGYLAAPRIWIVLPVQLVTVAAATTLGLHWGPRPSAARPPEPAASRRAAAAPPSPSGSGGALLAFPICPAG